MYKWEKNACAYKTVNRLPKNTLSNFFSCIFSSSTYTEIIFLFIYYIFNGKRKTCILKVSYTCILTRSLPTTENQIPQYCCIPALAANVLNLFALNESHAF